MGRYYLTQMLRLLKDKKLDNRLLDKKLAILAVKAEAVGYFNVMTAIDRLREMKNGPKPVTKECKHRFIDAMKRAAANPND